MKTEAIWIIAAYSVMALPARAEDYFWQLVPMRTAAEKAKGMAGGEMGQIAYTLAISAKDPNCMAMGIDTAAVYVSTNGGRNWELRRNGIHSNGVQSIAFDPVNTDVLWAAGLRSPASPKRRFPPDPKQFGGKADGIYRSDDLGKSWTLVFKAVFMRGQAQNEYFAFDPAGDSPRKLKLVP